MPIFSDKAIKKAVDEVDARDGNTIDVGIESKDGERPALVVEAQGEAGKLTWGAWAKTQLSKASTSVGAKIGIKWP